MHNLTFLLALQLLGLHLHLLIQGADAGCGLNQGSGCFADDVPGDLEEQEHEMLDYHDDNYEVQHFSVPNEIQFVNGDFRLALEAVWVRNEWRKEDREETEIVCNDSDEIVTQPVHKEAVGDYGCVAKVIKDVVPRAHALLFIDIAPLSVKQDNSSLVLEHDQVVEEEDAHERRRDERVHGSV